jgi:hypothetical protein
MADDDFAVEMLGRGIAPGRIAHFCSARHQMREYESLHAGFGGDASGLLCRSVAG